MKKQFLLLAILFTVGSAKAQFIKGDVGASIFIGAGKLSEGGFSEKLSAAFYGLSWYPRYMLNSNISVGVPLTLGFSGSFNSRTGGTGSFGLDLPVAVDYNFGYGADGNTEDSDATFGGFAGGGFSITKSSSSEQSAFGSYSTSASSYGPMAHGGVRFPIQGTRSITLMVSAKLGLDKLKYNFFGGTLLYKL
jgi:hypothetical protein